MKTLSTYTAVIVAVIAFIAMTLWIFPVWNVWHAKLLGDTALAQAAQVRTIMIETARVEKDAASLRAEAISTMGEAVKKCPEYLQQECVQAFREALREGSISQITQGPTEANIPVLEAGARK